MLIKQIPTPTMEEISNPSPGSINPTNIHIHNTENANTIVIFILLSKKQHTFKMVSAQMESFSSEVLSPLCFLLDWKV
jgi:hypothetical protein